MRLFRHRFSILLTAVILAVAVLGWLHNVPTAVTQEDERYLRLMFAEYGKESILEHRPISFSNQIDAILTVQQVVLSHAPEDKGIPFNVDREPRTLFETRFGLCYDRSRAIEKALGLIGFETRHIAIYETDSTGSALASLLTPGVGSHAVSEVKTVNGWIVVDSNGLWVSLSDDGQPISMDQLRRMASKGEAAFWHLRNKDDINQILTKKFTYMIGLYSRHGKFYRPFTPIPDVNWQQISANFL